MRRVTRTVIINRRGRSAGTDAGSGLGDQMFYVASVPGGKADLALNVRDGVAQSLTATGGRSVEPFAYATGPVGVLDAGFGWNDAGTVSTPFVQLVSQQTFDTCALGVVGEAGVAGGSGWSSTGSVSVPHVRRVSEELFEAYPTGAVASGSMTGGTGWADSAVVFAW